MIRAAVARARPLVRNYGAGAVHEEAAVLDLVRSYDIGDTAPYRLGQRGVNSGYIKRDASSQTLLFQS